MLKRLLVPISASLAVSAAGAETTIPNPDENTEQFEFEHVSCRGGDNEIRIIISGVKKSVGLITADLYPNNQEVFLRGEGRVKKVKFAAREPLTSFCINVPEAGDYALAVYHDENANGSFDKSAFGLPAEPWGISQNPKVRFGPPTVDEALFAVDEDGTKLEIKLN